MSIQLDTTTDGGANTASWNHTCTGSGLILFVAFATGGGTSVTYNGVAMTQISTPSAHLELFYLINPDVGTNTVSVTTGLTDFRGMSASYSGVSQTSFPDSLMSSSTSNALFTLANNVIADDCWIFGAGAADSLGITTLSTNRTDRQTGTFNITGNAITISDSNGTVTTGGQNTTFTAGGVSAALDGIIALSIAPSHDRYWVGGTADWNATAGSKWSYTSGGTGGADVPTSDDNVFIDVNSGLSGGTLSITDNIVCKNFTSTTGTSYTIDFSVAGKVWQVYGSYMLEGGITFANDSYVIFRGDTLGKTITMSSVNTLVDIDFGSLTNDSSWILQDDLSVTNQLLVYGGHLDANNKNVTANNFFFFADMASIPEVTMGSGIWEATGTGTIWNISESGGSVVTIHPDTSTIKFTSSNSLLGRTFQGGNKTYNNIWIATTGTALEIISGSNTFNDFQIDPAREIVFEDSTNTTVSSFNAIGNLGNLIILEPNSTTFTLTKTSGIVSVDYCDISGSQATGGAIFYAGANSNDGGGNTGWIFTAPPSTDNGNFLLLF